VVLVPEFDLTCGPPSGDSPDSTEPAVITAPNYGCPAGDLGGSGSNIWYRMPSFAFFELCGPTVAGCDGLHSAYIAGNNSAVCDTGNGATSCLVGRFKHIMATGTVGAGVGSGTGSKAVGIADQVAPGCGACDQAARQSGGRSGPGRQSRSGLDGTVSPRPRTSDVAVDTARRASPQPTVSSIV
jgi:hypothetical protein